MKPSFVQNFKASLNETVIEGGELDWAVIHPPLIPKHLVS
jgi:hypothetical protein